MALPPQGLREKGPLNILFPALSAGIASGFLFFVSASTETGGLFLVFLPVFPLMLAGLALGIRPIFTASMAAIITAWLFSGITGMIFFACFTALPVYYFLYRTLLWRGEENEREWYPMLRILSQLTIAVAAAFMILALLTAENGGLQSLMPNDLANNFKTADAEFNAMAQEMLNDWSFLLFALVGWLWVILIYGFAVLANVLLSTGKHALRPSLAVEPNGLPGWLLLLIIISGGLALFGRGIDRFTAETILLILLMPYLLCGLAFVHVLSRRRYFHFRKIWLTCFYILLLCTRWPLVGVVAIGLYIHLTELIEQRAKKQFRK